MQNTLKLLIELQEIEKKVRALAEQKARAPVQIAMMKEEETRAGGKVEERQEMLKSAQGLRKELEREVEDLQRRQSKSKQRLLEVKSNKKRGNPYFLGYSCPRWLNYISNLLQTF